MKKDPLDYAAPGLTDRAPTVWGFMVLAWSAIGSAAASAFGAMLLFNARSMGAAQAGIVLGVLGLPFYIVFFVTPVVAYMCASSCNRRTLLSMLIIGGGLLVCGVMVPLLFIWL